MKKLYRFFAAMVIAVLLGATYSCRSTPTGVPDQSSTVTPGPDAVPPTGSKPVPPSSLFKLMKSVSVTPAGNFLGGAFVRIGYVPGKDRMVVTFAAKLDQPEGGCAEGYGYAYMEFNRDMVETGDRGVISCFAATDVGGFFVGNDFYLASMGHDNKTGKDGWHLAKYDAVTWKGLVGPIFYPLDTGDAVGEDPGDPMLALVNGQIDVSSMYRFSPDEPKEPTAGHATHHQFFTTDLEFVSKRVLSDMPHIHLSSMIVAGGVTHFVTGTALLGDLVVMKYGPDWKFLGGQIIRQKAATPEGMAFDGSRFYVSYLDNSLCANFPCYQNVHLAAFDSNWNLLEDIAVTSFSPQDHKQTSRPSLTLWNGRIYVCYDQTENETFDPSHIPSPSDVQVHVKVYELSGQ